MNSASYDYSFSPNTGNTQGFYWEYAQQRNTMAIQLDTIENALMEHLTQGRLYEFTRTVNTLPHEHAALINSTILKTLAETIRTMRISRDARMTLINIFTSKFGHA